MNWEEIVGQKKLISTLINAIDKERVSHAQLFVGEEGFGTLPLALAYAKEILKRENEHASAKVEHLNHLDLHFSFPVFTEKKNSLSQRFYEEFREMILENPYASINEWNEVLDAQNKQLFISADEVDAQNQRFSLKSFDGGTKILIVWRADKMNQAAANKFLKFLEEPPKKTIILLLAEKIDDILPTILSRCQTVEVPRIDDESLQKAIMDKFDIKQNKTIYPPNVDKYKKFSREQLFSLFVGYIDGDGNIGKKHNREDSHIRIKVHQNWFEFVEFFNKQLDINTPLKITKCGYALLQISNYKVCREIKQETISLKIPFLKRKWELIKLK